MLDFHHSDRGSNPIRAMKFHNGNYTKMPSVTSKCHSFITGIKVWKHSGRSWRKGSLQVILDFGRPTWTSPVISVDHLNHYLNIHHWAHQWKMEFNPNPNKQATEVLFSCEKSNPNHPLLIFNRTAVTNVNEQKHLGLLIHSDCSFEKHLTEKIIEARRIQD